MNLSQISPLGWLANRAFLADKLRRFIKDPLSCLPAFKEALKSFANTLQDQGKGFFPFMSSGSFVVTEVGPESIKGEFHIGVEGSFGSHHVTPRDLSSNYLRTLVCLEGIVTKCSESR